MRIAENLESLSGSILTFLVTKASIRPIPWMISLNAMAREKYMRTGTDRVSHTIIRLTIVYPSSCKSNFFL